MRNLANRRHPIRRRFATTLWVGAVWLVAACVTTAVLVAYSFREWTIPSHTWTEFGLSSSRWCGTLVSIRNSALLAEFDVYGINGMTLSTPFPTTHFLIPTLSDRTVNCDVHDRPLCLYTIQGDPRVQ